MRDETTSNTGTYEFSAQENSLIVDLASKMKGVAVFMALIGVLALVGTIASAVRSRLDIAVILFLGAGFFGAIACWTLLASRSFRKIVDTEGNDILHTMAALGQLRRFYTLHFWLIIVYVGLIVLAMLGYPPGLG